MFPRPGVHVGRQPIFSRSGDVHGYELLFRGDAAAVDADERGAYATSRVLITAFTGIGIEPLCGHGLCFVNLTREFLVGELPLPFDAEQVVLEILETVEIDDAVVAAVEKLVRQGYRIALDDYVFGLGHEPLLELAAYVKIDILETPGDELVATVERCRKGHRLAVDGFTGDPATARLLPHVHYVKVDMLAGDRHAIAAIVDQCRRIPRIRLIAQRIQNEELLELAIRHRFQLYQGHALSRPHLVTTRALNPTRLARARLLTELAAEDVDLDRAVATIERDPALAVRILRGVNAAANGLKRPVSSIFQAVVLLGIPQVRQWATLMMVADLADGDESVLTDAVVRARMCQTVAEHRGAGAGPTAFTVGLLSAIGDLLGGPAGVLTDHLPLTAEVAEAVVHGRGELGEVLRDVRSYQRGEPRLEADGELHAELLAALSWTNASLAEPEPAAS
ncbi:EAL and HDOD domain-containing protein [Dactylosporangium sp. McL0621]|uniref:EAL and HDOD domain-containing protein n=1 Tax=Dactylosporangium sp. McL0621 TaxID=3415678 RepID=UPI003CF0007E